MVTPWSKVVGSSIQFWLLEINPHAKSYVVKGKVVQCAIVFAVNTALNNEAATVDLSRVVAAPRWRTRVGNIPIDATSVGRLVKSSMEHDLELLGTNWADLSLVIHVYPLGWLVVAVVFASLEEALLVHFWVVRVPNLKVIKRLSPFQFAHVVSCATENDYEAIHEWIHGETEPLLNLGKFFLILFKSTLFFLSGWVWFWSWWFEAEHVLRPPGQSAKTERLQIVQ